MSLKKSIKGFFREMAKKAAPDYGRTLATRQEYQERLKMSLRDWLVYHHKEIVFKNNYWMGVKALKNPFDCWIYQEIIHEVKPDVIIEIGCAQGGSALYLANLLDLLDHGEVISIDKDRSKFRVSHKRIIEIEGDSTSPQVLEQTAKLCSGKSALVIQDGDHYRDGVLKDLRNYSPFVSLGSYFIVEDGIVDLYAAHEDLGMKVEGPLPAIADFLRENPNFVVDKERERYLLTYNPNGYLKRIG